MIYLFNRKKEMVKMIPFRNIITAHQTKEVNGLYKLDIELPLFFRNNKGQFFNHKKNVDNAVFIGHFDDAEKFQLYKIHSRVVSNDNLIVSAVHIFFDEALAMDVIRDKRPTSIDAKTASEIAFGSTGWRVADYDTTDLKSTNFYYITPVEARKKIIETWNVEFDYGLTFNGQKIISKDLYIKKHLGAWKGKRFAYGSNLLSITDEQNEAEVVTAVIGRGKGEEVGDGYGRRIDFADITWTKDGITKTAGKDYIEIPSATERYGYYDEATGTTKARIGVIVFDDIEDKTELANASYAWLLENCVPKSVMQTTVSKIGGVSLGDDIAIIYQDIEIAKMARVQKMVVDLIDEHKSEVTIGDYQYFKEDKAIVNLKREVTQTKNEAEHYITQLKRKFDADFSQQTEFIEGKIAQVVQDAEADVLASETKMREVMADMKRETDATMAQFNNNLSSYDMRINSANELANKALSDVLKNSDSIKEVKDAVAGQTAEISNLNNEIKLKATKTEVTDAINSIEIGGKNYIPYSDFRKSEDIEKWALLNDNSQVNNAVYNNEFMWVHDAKTTGEHGRISQRTYSKLEANKDYILTFIANNNPTVKLKFTDADSTTVPFILKKRENIGGVYYKHTLILKSPLNEYAQLIVSNVTVGFTIKEIQLEDGTIPSDWSIAPEDYNARITKNEADIVIANDAITKRVTKTEYDTKTNQMQSQINTAVSTAERNTQTISTLQGDIDKVESWQIQNGSVIDQTAKAISNRVWQSDIDSLVFQNENLEFDSNFESNSMNGWGAGGYSREVKNGVLTAVATNTGNGTYLYKSITNLNKGRYTFSFSMKSTLAIKNFYLTGGLKFVSQSDLSASPNEFKTYSVTFDKNTDATATETIFFYLADAVVGSKVEVDWYKLEVGSKATEWTPSVREISAEYVKQSAIITTADGIQIGSKIIKGDTLASVISVTPSNVDIITRAMRITGDMQVAGDVKSLSLSAVYADIAKLRANVITADSVDASALKVDLSMINKLFAQEAYITALTSKSAFIQNVKAIDLSADRITGGVLRSSNENVNWDLDSGVIYFNNPRNAMRYTSKGWTSGLHFSQDNAGQSSAVVGVSKTSPDLDSNSTSFIGIKAIAEGSALQVWGGSMALMAKTSATALPETVWQFDMEQNADSPSGVRAIVGYKNAQLGREGYKFDRVWTKNMNRMRVGTESIESESGANGIYFNSSGSMLIKRKGKYYDIDVVLRASGFTV